MLTTSEGNPSLLRPALMLRMSACAPTCRWGPFYKPHPFKHLVPRVLCSPAPCGHGFEILETQNSSKSLWGGDSCWKEAGEGRSWAFSPPDSERFRCPDQAGGAVLPLSPTPRPPPLTSPSAWATGNKQIQGEPREGRPGGSVGKPEADLPRPPRLGLPLPVSTHRPLPGPPRGAALGTEEDRCAALQHVLGDSHGTIRSKFYFCKFKVRVGLHVWSHPAQGLPTDRDVQASGTTSLRHGSVLQARLQSQ